MKFVFVSFVSRSTEFLIFAKKEKQNCHVIHVFILPDQKANKKEDKQLHWSIMKMPEMLSMTSADQSLKVGVEIFSELRIPQRCVFRLMRLHIRFALLLHKLIGVHVCVEHFFHPHTVAVCRLKYARGLLSALTIVVFVVSN